MESFFGRGAFDTKIFVTSTTTAIPAPEIITLEKTQVKAAGEVFNIRILGKKLILT